MLDEPGEWYLDGTAGALFYWPLPGEDLTSVEVVAPVLSELVRFDGNPDEGKFVDHVHHVVRGMLSDAGGIYTLGTQTGTVIRNNVFHDVWPYVGRPAMAWGIYFDAGSNGLLVENNVVYNTLTGGIMNTGTHGNVIRNNIFAQSAWHAVWRYTWQKEPSSIFQRNIIYLTQGELFHNDGGRSDFRSQWDHNLYWRADGKPLLFYDDELDQWQAKGMDQSGLVADPRFVDAANCDFRLRPDSPALELGFRPIDPSTAGLSGPPEWIALARQRRAELLGNGRPLPSPSLCCYD